MTPSSKGWFIFIAALGMALTLMSAEITSLHSWAELAAPPVAGKLLAHIGSVIGAFVGGRLIPTGDEK